MYFLRVYLIKTSSAVSLNTATESGIIRWQIDKAASIALASSNWHTLLTPVQEAFRMNKNLVSYFFFFSFCAYWHQLTDECRQSPPASCESNGIKLPLNLSHISFSPLTCSFSSWPTFRLYSLSFCCIAEIQVIRSNIRLAGRGTVFELWLCPPT